jgi:hypothetical protein
MISILKWNKHTEPEKLLSERVVQRLGSEGREGDDVRHHDWLMTLAWFFRRVTAPLRATCLQSFTSIKEPMENYILSHCESLLFIWKTVSLVLLVALIFAY